MGNLSGSGRTWTPERVELLCALWGDGVSAGLIAKRLGVTRSTVSAKRHHLGLPPRLGDVAKAAMAANGRRTAVLCGRLNRSFNPPGPMVRPATPVDEALAAVATPLAGSNPRPWIMREPGECAFPVEGYGDGTLSCCLPVEAGTEYCLGHLSMLRGKPWPPVDARPELAATQWVAPTQFA